MAIDRETRIQAWLAAELSAEMQAAEPPPSADAFSLLQTARRLRGEADTLFNEVIHGARDSAPGDLGTS
jgi:hypothetical protein